jgi:uncharacterized protein (TIGR00645 family)
MGGEMTKPGIERGLEAALFASRWLLAPFYVGLAFALLVLLGVFGVDLWSELTHLVGLAPGKMAEGGIVMALSLIDLSLTASLLIVVIFSGYENFVSRIDTAASVDRPDWMGTIDFSALKMKLMASIVAISAVALLKSFLVVADEGVHDAASLAWQVGIHLTFVVSGVMLALMDFISSRSGGHGGGKP